MNRRTRFPRGGRTGIPLVVALLATLVAVFALAGCGTSSGDPIALDYTFNKGDSYTYDLSLKADGNISGEGLTAEEQAQIPKQASMTGKLAIEVTDVDENGTATLQYSLTDASAEVDGESKPLDMNDETQTVKIDKDGNILSVDGKSPAEGMQGLPLDPSQLPFDPAQFAPKTDFMYPEGGVAKPGDTWETKTTYPIPLVNQEVVATSSGKLVSVEDRNGRQVANLEFSGEIPLDLNIDFADIFSSLGLDQLMQGGLQMEGTEGFQMQMPQFTLVMSGKPSMEGTASVFTDTGFPASLDANASTDLTLEVKNLPADQAADMPQGPVTIDYTLQVEMKEVS